eukprot:5085942-Pleurochrysis_carterae.AAC.1
MHSCSWLKTKWRPRRSADGATRKRVTRRALALNAASRAWICCCADVKSIERRERSRSKNSLERMARLSLRQRGCSPAAVCGREPTPLSVASCARVSVSKAATMSAPSAERET